MEIKVEKWIVDGNVSYKILSIDKCCDKLINSKNTTINNGLDEFNNYYDEDQDSYSVKIARDEYDYDGWNDTYYEAINYCPWCGSRIEIEVINVIDKTEEYLSLRKERDTLWEKCRKTDSKKQENELEQQVRELDKKSNGMYISDDFTKEEV